MVCFTSHMKTDEVASWQFGYHLPTKGHKRQSPHEFYMYDKQSEVNYRAKRCSKT